MQPAAGGAQRRTVKVSRTFTDAFLSFLRDSYSSSDKNGDGLLDAEEFQHFLQKAANRAEATLADAKQVLLAVTKKEEGPINFMQVMNGWHLIGLDLSSADAESNQDQVGIGGAAAFRQVRRQSVQPDFVTSSKSTESASSIERPKPTAPQPKPFLQPVSAPTSSPNSPSSAIVHTNPANALRGEVSQLEHRLEALRHQIRTAEGEYDSKLSQLRSVDDQLQKIDEKLKIKEQECAQLAARGNGGETVPVPAQPSPAPHTDDEIHRVESASRLKKMELKELEDKLTTVEEQLALKMQRKEQIETSMKRLLERLLEKEAQLDVMEKKFEETRAAMQKEVSKNESNIRKLQRRVKTLSEEVVDREKPVNSHLLPENSSGSFLAAAGSDIASQVVGDSRTSSTSSNGSTKKKSHASKMSRSVTTLEIVEPAVEERHHSSSSQSGTRHRATRSLSSSPTPSKIEAPARTRTVSGVAEPTKDRTSTKEGRKSVGHKDDDEKRRSQKSSRRSRKSIQSESRPSIAGSSSSEQISSSDSSLLSRSSADVPEIVIAPSTPKVESVLDWYLNHPERLARVIKCQQFCKHFLTRKHTKRLSGVIRSYSVSEQSKASRQRNAALREIFTSEKSYFESLKMLNDAYIVPIRRMKILSEDEADRIFSDIEIIVEITHTILEKMEQRLALWPSVQRVGDIFRDSAPLMKLYYRYIRDFEKMNTRMAELQHQRPDFTEYIQKAARSKANGQTLLSLLIMPVQRLPRYELLLKNLFKLTQEGHVDFENLAAAVDSVVQVNQYINVRTRKEHLRSTVETLLSKKSSRKLLVLAQNDQKRFLKVNVSQARGIPAVDMNGMSDPFVELEFEDEQWRTKVQYKTLSPIWHEEFVLVILPSSPPTFTVSVYDYDRIGSNTLIGTLRFNVKDFLGKPKDEEVSSWFKLDPPQSKRHYDGEPGEILLSFQMTSEL